MSKMLCPQNYNLTPTAESLTVHIKNFSLLIFGRFKIYAHWRGKRIQYATGKFTVYRIEWRDVKGKPVLCHGQKINNSGWSAERVAEFLAKQFRGEK